MTESDKMQVKRYEPVRRGAVRLYKKVTQQIIKDITGSMYESYETIEPLENFLRGLEEMGNTQVLRHMVAMLNDEHAREYQPKHWNDEESES